MPTYEYACEACGHRFEEFQSITAKPIKVCPVCKKRKVKRLISAGAGFIFKGSGFYETDYRSESYKSDAKADAPKTEPAVAAKSDGAAAGGKTETAAPAKVEAPAAAPAAAAKPAGKATKSAKK